MFGLFCPDSILAEEIGTNSQNMALLQAVITPDPKASTTKDSSVIIASNSLAIETQVSPDSKIVDNDQISLYVVHQGDTLPAIAKMFGVSVNTIRWGNDIKGNSVSVGQTLVIMPISGIQHTVKSGDTLQSIAKQHKGDMDEILQYNNLVKNSKIAVGDVIFVPDGEAVSTPSTNTNPKTTKPSTSMPVYDGYYMRPIIGGVKTQGVHGHNGVDLASSYGAKIYASADGEVLISKNSGWNGGYGSYIVLKHGNGTQTLYGHLSGTAVSAGDTVKQGQVIGYMGNSGQVTGHTGIHLHFEIRGARNPF
jgi:LysM repeat protein